MGDPPLSYRLDDYDYPLPEDRIAQSPAEPRDASRLLLLRRDSPALAHHVFRDLPELLRPGDLLVLNRSRVFPARILARRATGARVEVLLVRDRGGGEWDAWLRPNRRVGREPLHVDGLEAPPLRVCSDAVPGDPTRTVRIDVPPVALAAWLERHGRTPLPPYIRRDPDAADRERYQTVYAREPGSVAAPTAGLHFTPALLERLSARGIHSAEVVLHVGPGTFRPVEVDDVREHRVPPEHVSLPEATVQRILETRARGGRVVAVGTTSVRVLESAASPDGRLRPFAGSTDRVVLPGDVFRATDALLTNFHLPRSSLLLLVAAFAGRERVLDAYAEAVAQRYRFYSYGDAMLIL